MNLIIDAHSHLYPQSYVSFLRSRREIPRIDERDDNLYFTIFPEEEQTGGRLIEPRMWSVEEKLAHADAGGINRAVVSLGNPWLDPIRGSESVELAEQVNGDLAGLEAQTGGRLCGLGVLPNAEPEIAASIAEQISRTDGLYGIITGCRICGYTFDDPELEPVWAELSRGGLPVFVHPHHAAAIDQLGGFGTVLPLGIGFPMETSIAIARLVLSGVLRRHPKLKILVAHAGGVLPFLAARLDVAWRGDTRAQERLPVPPSQELAKLWLDAVAYHPRALHAAADLVGKDHLVFGTDHPFFKEQPHELIASVEAAFSEDDAGLDAVAARNAISLFALPEA